MARAGIPNVAASVHARLKRTRRPDDDFNLILQRYVGERFLYRLGASDVSDRFVLKGASMFLVWSGDIFRGTQDIDLLGTDPTMAEAVGRALGLICAVPCPEDGVSFDPTRIRITDIPVEEKRALRFDGPTLRLAVRRTMMQRGPISGDAVPGLQAGYYLDAERQGHWERWLDRVVVHGYRPATLAEAGRAVRSFLEPVWASVVDGVAFEMDWPAGGPWRPRSTGAGRGD